MKSSCFLLMMAALALGSPVASQPLPVGPEIPIEPPGALAVQPASIALGSDGGFLAAWTPAAAPFVAVRAFSPAGHPLLSQETAVHESGASPAIAPLGNGRFVVVWNDVDDLPGAQPFVSSRLVNASGEAIGAINRVGLGGSEVVAGLPSGDYVVAWLDPSGRVLARRFNAATPVTGEVVVTPIAGVELSVAAMPDGGFAVAWQFGGGVHFRVFGPDGTPVTDAIPAIVTSASRRHPRISTDAAGHIVIAWLQVPLQGTPADDQIMVRRFSPAGIASEPAVPVRVARGLGPPHLAVRPDGGFLVLWTESNEDGEPLALAQVYDAQRARVGDAFRVHGSPQAIASDVAADENGWLVSWTGTDQAYVRRLATTCGTDTPGMCLNDSRFHVRVDWRHPITSDDLPGHPVQLSNDTGAFWFFSPDNTELVVKVLDGRELNGRFWVFYASLTDVQFDLTVTDRATQTSFTWRNLHGTVASHADTNAFADLGTPPSPTFLEAPLFTPRPLAAGPELPLLSTVAELSGTPRLASRDDGFAAAWLTVPGPPAISEPTLTARGFDGSGQALGGEQPVSAAFEDPRVDPFDLVALAAEPQRYVAVWTALEASTGEVSGRLLDAAGTPLAPRVVLAQDALESRAAALPTGGLVAVWRQASSGRILVRRFSSFLNPAGSEIVAGTGSSPDIAALPDGGFAVAWVVPGSALPSIVLRTFWPDGTPRGPARAVPQTEALYSGLRIAANPAGRLVVAWSASDLAEPTLSRTLARVFAVDGQPLGPEILVEQSTLKLENRLAAVAMQSDGSFLVLSEQLAVGGDDRTAVVAHLYDPAGRPLGAPFPVHDEKLPHHEAGDVVPSGNGWLMAWRRNVLDVSQSLHARLFTSTCGASSGLCLNDGRFRVEASWHIPGTGQRGTASPVVLADDTGLFWFFSADNTELIVKVLDGRGVNGHFWVFFGSLTNVEFDLTVTDTLTGQQRTYHNPAGTMASRADTEAF